MFCPKCATQNIDGASYCRACGANISLVPQALSGQLPVPQAPDDDRLSRRKRRRLPSVEEAIRSLIMGIAFVVVAFLAAVYAPAGRLWWFWLFIPAAASLGRGITELVRLKIANQPQQTFSQPRVNPVRPADLPAPRTGELMPPVPSVTEGTTRHLGSEPANKHFDSVDQRSS